MINLFIRHLILQGLILLSLQAHLYSGESSLVHVYTDADRDRIITWGQEANGFSAGLKVVPENTNRFIFEVLVRRSNTSIWVKTNLAAGPLFLRASNDLCCPIELCDSRGRVVPLLKTNNNQLSCYPLTLSWNSFFCYNAYSGPYPSSLSLFPQNSKESTASLKANHLNDYYNITNAGDYQFSVNPVIYIKSSTNEDIYNRIDIPPVTVGVRFSGVSIGK